MCIYMYVLIMIIQRITYYNMSKCKTTSYNRARNQERIRNRTESAEPNRTEPINSGTGRNRTRSRTEPNRTEPGPNQTEKRRPNRVEPGKLIVRSEPNRTDACSRKVRNRTDSFLILSWAVYNRVWLCSISQYAMCQTSSMGLPTVFCQPLIFTGRR